MSESLTRHMRNYIRERASTPSMRCRITRNAEWGLGLSLMNRDNYIQLFLPLERVRDEEQDATIVEETEGEEDDEIVLLTLASTMKLLVNHKT